MSTDRFLPATYFSLRAYQRGARAFPTSSVSLPRTTRFLRLLSSLFLLLCLLLPSRAHAYTVSSLTISPNTVGVGATTSGTVVLSASVTVNTPVTLSSSDTSKVTVPASVTVNAGSASAMFTLTAVSTNTVPGAVTITATLTGSSKTAVVTVITVQSLTVLPTTVFEGTASVGTVTLSAPVAASTVVTLSSLDTTKATVPTTATVGTGSQSTTFTITTPTSNTVPGPVTIKAALGASFQTAALTINVFKKLPPVLNLRCTDLTLTPTLRIDWDYTPPTPNVAYDFVWTRTAVTPLVPPGVSLPPLVGSNATVTVLYAIDTVAWTAGVAYIYAVQAIPHDAMNLVNGYRYTPSVTTSIPVTPEQMPLADNQTVDARYDLRYSTYTFLDHNFGDSIYRGGLFVGNAPDSSRMGRSFLRFSYGTAPIDAYHHLYPPVALVDWTAKANVYFLGAQKSSPMGGWTLGAQLVTDNGWAPADLTWDTAPTLAPASPAYSVSVPYDTTMPSPYWCSFPLGNTIGGQVSECLGLAVTTEANDQAGSVYSWLYFAKKEYPLGQAASLLYAWSGAPTVTLTLSVSTIKGGNSLTGTLSSSSLTSPLTVSLFTDKTSAAVPAQVTIPVSGSVTFPITTSTVATNTTVKIVYGYNSYKSLTVTP